jgi:PAS domain-containing protein
MLGYTRNEILGMCISDVEVDENAEDIATRIGRTMKRRSELFCSRHRRKDGSVFPVEVSTTFLDEAEGRFVCFGRHLTERRQQEERSIVLGHMLDSAPALITIHDHEGRYFLANRKAVGSHGYDDEKELLAVKLSELNVPESAAFLEELLGRIIEEGEVRFIALIWISFTVTDRGLQRFRRPNGFQTQNVTIHIGALKTFALTVVQSPSWILENQYRKKSAYLHSLYPEMKALFMSGYTADVIAHHGELDKDVHFIQKPFSMKNLTAKVRCVLENEKIIGLISQGKRWPLRA